MCTCFFQDTVQYTTCVPQVCQQFYKTPRTTSGRKYFTRGLLSTRGAMIKKRRDLTVDRTRSLSHGFPARPPQKSMHEMGFHKGYNVVQRHLQSHESHLKKPRMRSHDPCPPNSTFPPNRTRSSSRHFKESQTPPPTFVTPTAIAVIIKTRV